MSVFIEDFLKYDLYSIFLLNKKTFTINSLRKSYQRLVLVYHPDKFDPDLNEEEKKEKYDAFNLINNSYTILSNDALRNEYDEKMELKQREEKGFFDLKNQFNEETDKNKNVSLEEFEKNKIDTQNEFERKMKEMNQQLEDKVNNNNISDLLGRLTLERDKETNDILNSIKPLTDEDKLFLTSTKITPMDNFDREFAMKNTNRDQDMKKELGTDLYNGLTKNGMDDNYASFDDAFKPLT